MTEVIPGVYIIVNAEGLISPGQITTGNIGMIGTASRGPIGVPTLLGSFAEAKQIFGAYDQWPDGDLTAQAGVLTLVRALELAYSQGATIVYAVRITETDASGNTTAVKASATLNSASGPNVTLRATTEGTWGNDLVYNVAQADQDPIVSDETVGADASGKIFTLKHSPVKPNARNVIRFKSRTLIISYGDSKTTTKPPSGGVLVNTENGALTFPDGDPTPTAGDLTATYAVSRVNAANKPNAVKVTLRLGQVTQTFIAIDGDDLVQKINNTLTGSTWVQGTAETNSGELPTIGTANVFSPFSSGLNGDNSNADYTSNLDLLLDQDVQIIVAAGQDSSFGNTLDMHCQRASTDDVQSERIGLVGSAALGTGGTISSITSHNINSNRVVLVGPGIQVMDNAATPPVNVTLPGSYAAAAVAGLLSSFEPHISLTNKVLPVNGLEQVFNRADLTELLLARVMALESHQGFRIVRGITTSTNTAWQQLTTVRIVDYAKRGVRQSADPYIGLLNNDRVRGALRATINSFLTDMLNAEMLVGYDLNVTATREQQIQGIVQVTMTLQPVFSIDFIQVTMFLQ